MKQTMQKLALLLPLLASGYVSLGRQKDPVPALPKAAHVAKAAFTGKDATEAYRSFNNYFYSAGDKLYYATSEQKGLGAIWTQAIYWDMAMDAYKRTKAPAYLQLVNDIYQGGWKKYDQYNWNNKAVW
ncbi:MAG TPA: alpha-1,6-mannanase, partial [Chitinophaga sp.]